jgi:hypothetical protein
MGYIWLVLGFNDTGESKGVFGVFETLELAISELQKQRQGKLLRMDRDLFLFSCQNELFTISKKKVKKEIKWISQEAGE